MEEWRGSGFISCPMRCLAHTMDYSSILLGEWVWLVGGVTEEVREWFYLLSHKVFSPYYGLCLSTPLGEWVWLVGGLSRREGSGLWRNDQVVVLSTLS